MEAFVLWDPNGGQFMVNSHSLKPYLVGTEQGEEVSISLTI